MVVIHLHLLMFHHLSLAQRMQELVICCGFCSSSAICCTLRASVLVRYKRSFHLHQCMSYLRLETWECEGRKHGCAIDEDVPKESLGIQKGRLERHCGLFGPCSELDRWACRAQHALILSHLVELNWLASSSFALAFALTFSMFQFAWLGLF